MALSARESVERTQSRLRPRPRPPVPQRARPGRWTRFAGTPTTCRASCSTRARCVGCAGWGAWPNPRSIASPSQGLSMGLHCSVWLGAPANRPAFPSSRSQPSHSLNFHHGAGPNHLQQRGQVHPRVGHEQAHGRADLPPRARPLLDPHLAPRDQPAGRGTRRVRPRLPPPAPLRATHAAAETSARSTGPGRRLLSRALTAAPPPCASPCARLPPRHPTAA
jgi:hypothetical protein